MRKKVFGRKLSRDRGSREALFRSLVKAFVERGIMVTTKAKAKAVQPMIEKLVSAAKNKEVATIRRIHSYIANDKKTAEALFGKIANAFKDRNGGFTRIINLPRRMGDAAEMARVEWTEKIEMSDKQSTAGKQEVKSKKKVSEGNEEKTVKPTLKSRVTKLLSSKKSKK